MQTVVLTEQEWQQVLACIAQAPWNIANPLLMKIGEQLRAASGPANIMNLDKADNKEHRRDQ